MGGEFTISPADPSNETATNSGEIYDPAANAWTSISNTFPQQHFGDDPTVLLPNGKVLAGYIGGANTYVYDPNSADPAHPWAATGTKLRGDVEFSDEENWVLLPDGSVLSYDIFGSIAANNGAGALRAQRYVPSTGTWVDASNTSATNQPDLLSTATVGYEMGAPLLLPDGRVFELGANGNTAFYTPATATTSDYWSAGPILPKDASNIQLVPADAPAAVLPNGKVLLALSPLPIYSSPTYLYEFDPSTNQFTPVPPPSGSTLSTALANASCFEARMLVVPNGHVLFSIENSTQLWDYTPDGSALTAGKPTVSSVVANVDPNGAVGSDGTPYTLTGTNLTGQSEGAAYGDDAEMSTNFPIVQITDSAGAVRYAKTTNWTPGVADGATRTVQFMLPSSVASGAFSLKVIANGIASDSFTPAAPMFADRDWASLTAGTTVPDGTIGVNCFATVNAAIGHAPAGGGVIVYGYDGVNSGSGVFNEDVAVDTSVALSLQRGAVSFNSLSGTAAGSAIVLNGVNLTTDGDSSSDPYDGPITGAGGLIKVGSGTLPVAGADNTTGTTTVSGGTLLVTGSISGPGGVSVSAGKVKLGSASPNALAYSTLTVNSVLGLDLNSLAAAALGSLAGTGNISVGATALTVGGNNATTTYSGNFTSGAAALLIKTGKAGLWSLSGDNSNFFGGVTVNDGSVLLGSANALAGSTVTVTFPGVLSSSSNVPQAAVGGLAGTGVVSISNTSLTVGGNNVSTSYSGNLNISNGSFTKTGTGMLTVSGFDTVAGGVTISQGVVTIGSANALAGSTVTVNVEGGLDTGSLMAATLGGLAGTGAISLGNSAQAYPILTVGADNDPTTYAGVFSGAGTLNKTGTGTLTLSGTDSGTSSTTIQATVNGGTLLVTGTIREHGLTVNSGGTLRGTGTIAGPVAVAGGTLEAGSSTGPGLLTIGSLSFSNNGTFAVKLYGTGSYDQVFVTGNTDLTGAALSLTLASGFTASAGDHFNVIHGYNLFFFQFAVPFSSVSGTQSFSISYAGHAVILTYSP